VEDNPNPEGIAVTKDEIIEMAKQAGFEEHQAKFDTRFEPFAKLVAEKEREACAKIADEWAVGWPHPSQSIAEWIRKRT
jgi:hypothetical protein